MKTFNELWKKETKWIEICMYMYQSQPEQIWPLEAVEVNTCFLKALLVKLQPSFEQSLRVIESIGNLIITTGQLSKIRF